MFATVLEQIRTPPDHLVADNVYSSRALLRHTGST